MNEEVKTPDNLILEALGEASALFMSQPIKGTEIVMPEKELTAIATRLATSLAIYYLKPNLGLATTQQLLAEITARIEVDGQLDYKTVQGSEPTNSKVEEENRE